MQGPLHLSIQTWEIKCSSGSKENPAGAPRLPKTVWMRHKTARQITVWLWLLWMITGFASRLLSPPSSTGSGDASAVSNRRFLLFQINVIEAKKKTDILMAVSWRWFSIPRRYFCGDTFLKMYVTCNYVLSPPVRCCLWWSPRLSSSNMATSLSRSWTSIGGNWMRR